MKFLGLPLQLINIHEIKFLMMVNINYRSPWLEYRISLSLTLTPTTHDAVCIINLKLC